MYGIRTLLVKVTDVLLKAAVVGCESVTVVPETLITEVPGAIPAPDTNWPATMPEPEATVSVVLLAEAVPVVFTGLGSATASSPPTTAEGNRGFAAVRTYTALPALGVPLLHTTFIVPCVMMSAMVPGA